MIKIYFVFCIYDRFIYISSIFKVLSVSKASPNKVRRFKFSMMGKQVMEKLYYTNLYIIKITITAK